MQFAGDLRNQPAFHPSLGANEAVAIGQPRSQPVDQTLQLFSQVSLSGLTVRALLGIQQTFSMSGVIVCSLRFEK